MSIWVQKCFDPEAPRGNFGGKTQNCSYPMIVFNTSGWRWESCPWNIKVPFNWAEDVEGHTRW